MDYQFLEDRNGHIHCLIHSDPPHLAANLQWRDGAALDALYALPYYQDWSEPTQHRPPGTVIADQDGIYPQRMGPAGQRAFHWDFVQGYRLASGLTVSYADALPLCRDFLNDVGHYIPRARLLYAGYNFWHRHFDGPEPAATILTERAQAQEETL